MVELSKNMEINILINLQTGKVEYPDYILENLWESQEDVLFVEDENSDDSCYLVLNSDWNNGINDFPKGTTRDEIWHWFDVHHSKGVGWLLKG